MDSANIMVIMAHPDDAEFGIAGSVARWTLQGANVVYIVCSSGEKGTTDREITTKQLLSIREKEQQAAADVLGVKKVIFLRYPDQEIEDTPQFRKHMVRLIRQYRPERVATSDPYRRYLWHRDHRVVGQVVLDALYPFARDHLAYPDLLEKGLEPHKVHDALFWGAEDVNYHSDISRTFSTKLRALQCHVSQVRELGIPDLEYWLYERCRKMAIGSDFELAEAFHRVVFP